MLSLFMPTFAAAAFDLSSPFHFGWEWIGPASSFAGFAILWIRFQPIIKSLFSSLVRSRESEGLGEHASSFSSMNREPSASDAVPQAVRVSIVIPARNEALNLPKLFESISKLDWEDLEVIVVDDESSDGTRAIATDLGAALIERSGSDRLNPWRFVLVDGRPRPTGWTGKNWACHQGYEHATGSLLLFTDADTTHEPGSIRDAVAKMARENLDLLSAAPFHRCELWWEKFLGPFQLFLFVSTAAFSRPKEGRVFAIGQYLLFRKEAYVRQGGHERIKGTLCDDLELAHECLRAKGVYSVEGARRLFQVQMYPNFQQFLRGWRRIFRLGFRHARMSAGFEIYFAIAALTAGMMFFAAPMVSIVLMFASLLLLAVIQRRFGDFSVFGVLVFPLSLFIFVLVSVLALFDLVGHRDYAWRGRTYQNTADS